MRRATSLIHTSEIKILLNLLSILLALIFVNVKTLIMLMLFLGQVCGHPMWSLQASWCPWYKVWEGRRSLSAGKILPEMYS